MDGKSQSWVASAFGVNQSTVSRIIQRYERWQAHAKERENGRLDHQERLRAQRWLTYERNELILASCLRIAGELEGSIDISRSTIRRAASDPTQEIEVRTHHACIDRTGMVSRFLRLAHRINMEQLKLAELAEPPAAEALSPEELAAEEAQAAADAAELAAARQRSRDSARQALERRESHRDDVSWAPPAEDPVASDQEPGSIDGTESQPDGETQVVTQATHHSPAAGDVHNLHNENTPNITAITGQPCTCTLQARVEKNSPGVCITDPNDDPCPGHAEHDSRPLAAVVTAPPR